MPAVRRWSFVSAYIKRDTEWRQFPPNFYFFTSILSVPYPQPLVDAPLRHAAVPSKPKLLSRTFDPSRLVSDHRKLVIQTIAVTCASIGVLAATTTFYWFCRMRKRFRHR